MYSKRITFFNIVLLSYLADCILKCHALMSLLFSFEGPSSWQQPSETRAQRMVIGRPLPNKVAAQFSAVVWWNIWRDACLSVCMEKQRWKKHHSFSTWNLEEVMRAAPHRMHSNWAFKRAISENLYINMLVTENREGFRNCRFPLSCCTYWFFLVLSPGVFSCRPSGGLNRGVA